MALVIRNPFGDEPLEEVPLEPAPLVKVLAQVRFPAVAAISRAEFIAPFQEKLRKRYPVMRKDEQVVTAFTPLGVEAHKSQVWRLLNLEANWTVGLGTDFVSLETTAYESRADFVARLEEIFNAFDSMDRPAVVFDRLGVRYINRLLGADATTLLEQWVERPVFGALAIESEMPPGTSLLAGIAQAHFQLDGLQMQARWGRLPAGASFLPGIDPIDETSWVLDVDVFIEETTEFTVESATSATSHATAHAYAFFRWAMTDKFLNNRQRNFEL